MRVYNSKKNYLKDGAAENIVTDLLTEILVGITTGMIVVAEIRNRKEKVVQRQKQVCKKTKNNAPPKHVRSTPKRRGIFKPISSGRVQNRGKLGMRVPNVG